MKTPGEVLGPTSLTPGDIIRAIHAKVSSLDTTGRIDQFLMTSAVDKYTITKVTFDGHVTVAASIANAPSTTPPPKPGKPLTLTVPLKSLVSARSQSRPTIARTLADAIESVADQVFERTDRGVGINDIVVISTAMIVGFGTDPSDDGPCVSLEVHVGFGRSEYFAATEDGIDLAASAP